MTHRERLVPQFNWKPGTRLKVAYDIGFDLERELLGREFSVARMDSTHGYVVVTDGEHHWHLHPEALAKSD